MSAKERARGVLAAMRGGQGGGDLASLRQRVTQLEAEVQECRALNLRLAELTDIVGELLLPVAARDEEKLAALLDRYAKDL